MKLASKLNKIGLVALATAGVSCAFAQLSDKVVLKSHIGLSTFGSASGNDCWGYVSASGREYAIMGLDNKVAFIEITDPANPVIIKMISHSSSLWGDIKVYKGFAYAVTETAGTGIQVIDMNNIDNGVVTLVRTITNPSRAHNVSLDTKNGFLYTCGTRGGTGTTMCFDLANPSNPVQVGPGSMTTDYQHDGQLVSYTTGPMAGKQIWYGFSEGRGVDVYDFTNKAVPVFLKRIIYPNMNYCHQGWISEDGRYLYVDDELDEQGLNVNTRSLVFDVSDPVNAFFVGTFSTGLRAIDHNQYLDDGFTFQANYRSGLRIFDTAATPLSPTVAGYYDTYPADNEPAFNGAWSTYPFFPSGNVIISDLDDGFFVVDATAALTRTKAPADFSISAGQLMAGGLSGLSEVDGNVVKVGNGPVVTNDPYPVGLEAWTYAFDEHPDKFKVTVVARGDSKGYDRKVDVYDWAHSTWVQFDSRREGFSNSTSSFDITSNVSDFVQPGTKAIKVRVHWRPDDSLAQKFIGYVDQIKFEILR